jgi:hypothetical protein
MQESFAQMLTVGGKTNSLGRAGEVVDIVLYDASRLEELYQCMFDEDAWVRMRAADSLEKICRLHPDWFISFIDRFLNDFSANTQPSIQWHLAQMYGEVELIASQRKAVLAWLTEQLSSTDVDWIVASNAMQTLVRFAKSGWAPAGQVMHVLVIQQGHPSKAVTKRATTLLGELQGRT